MTHLLQVILAVAGFFVVMVQAASTELKEAGYTQILPRGNISAVVEPVFVAAASARLRPSSKVLGVVIDGEARAYSLALLNAHEIVNDRIGDVHYAAVW